MCVDYTFSPDALRRQAFCSNILTLPPLLCKPQLLSPGHIWAVLPLSPVPLPSPPPLATPTHSSTHSHSKVVLGTYCAPGPVLGAGGPLGATVFSRVDWTYPGGYGRTFSMPPSLPSDVPPSLPHQPFQSSPSERLSQLRGWVVWSPTQHLEQNVFTAQSSGCVFVKSVERAQQTLLSYVVWCLRLQVSSHL